MSATDPKSTRALTVRDRVAYIPRFAVAVEDGPEAGVRVESTGEELTVGTVEGNDLVVTDSAVSRHHLSLRVHERGIEARDLGSTNGTFAGEMEISGAYLRDGARITIGRTTLRIAFLDDEIAQPLADGDRFEGLIGASPAMRRLFPVLERYAASDATVLVTGETGTGKEVVAESIHARSRRRARPFVVVDCGALPPHLMVSELFGHVRGAFTGADRSRTGAFAAADGGTLFLDEIGELPRDLQPVLLRVLESRRIRPVGSDTDQRVDVRIIAATNRDLRTEVNARRFRSDLYFRLDVLHLEIPPLRARGDDVELLAAHFWKQSRPGTALPDALRRELHGSRWPGNVRELRNAIERAALLGARHAEGDQPLATFADAKDAVVDAFEREYIERLLARTGGNLTHAAKIAGMSRSHFRLVMLKCGIERDSFS
jgi:transcriptional regulator with GAF, ATPase, and Fis domain